jgi:hypothetical protein
MNLPAFTSEASIYETRGYYWVGGISGGDPATVSAARCLCQPGVSSRCDIPDLSCPSHPSQTLHNCHCSTCTRCRSQSPAGGSTQHYIIRSGLSGCGRDELGNCVQDCYKCSTPKLDLEHCLDYTLPCPDKACTNLCTRICTFLQQSRDNSYNGLLALLASVAAGLSAPSAQVLTPGKLYTNPIQSCHLSI